MTFDIQQPGYLILFILIPIFIYIYYQGARPTIRKKDKIVLYIRLALISLLILSLAQPMISRLSREQTVMFLVDRSASISQELKEKERNFIQAAIKSKQSDDQFGVLAFGENPMFEKKIDTKSHFYDFETDVNQNFTDIKKALQLGLNSISNKEGGRVVLISDGRENIGSAREIINEYQKQGVKVDVYSLMDNVKKEVLVKNLALPQRISDGGRFKIKTTIKSSYNVNARLSIFHNQKIIKEKNVELKQGNNYFEYPFSLSTPGLQKFRVKIRTSEDKYSENNIKEGFIIVEGQKRVLLVGESTGAQSFKGALQGENILVDQVKGKHFNFNQEELLQYDALVLNNIPVNTFNLQQMKNIISYVQDTGGGLLVTGGGSSFGAGNYSNTPLDSVLPITAKVKSKVFFPATTLLVTLDKSESMKEIQSGSGNLTKLDLAKEATVGILDIMVRDEKIGIVVFDTKADLVVPIQKAENKMEIYKKLSQIKADGGTDIYGGIVKSFNILKQDDSAVKHIILLSDGKSIPANFKKVINKLNEAQITLTTVALGEKVDKDLMQQLAQWGKGKYYYTDNVNSLPQIFSAEAKRIISTPIRRKEFTPQVNEGFNLITEINPKNIPPLEGFVATTPKKLADVILKSPDDYPIFASWRYGLGKTAAFTADLGERFSRQWVSWPGYNKFWPDVVNWLMRSNKNNNIFPYIEREGNKGIIRIDAVNDQGDYLNYLNLEATINKPEEKTTRVNLSQIGPGEYQGQFNINDRGIYLVTISWGKKGNMQSRVTGYVVSYSPEYNLFQGGEDFLEQIAEKTEGRILSSADEIFSYRPFSYTGHKSIWPYLIIVSLFLFLIDIAFRVVNFGIIKKIIFNFKNRLFAFFEDIRKNITDIEE